MSLVEMCDVKEDKRQLPSLKVVLMLLRPAHKRRSPTPSLHLHQLFAD